MRASLSFPYIKPLDGLRGFAVIIVMVHHAIRRHITGGFFGVDIFFVLSGFLITSLLAREYQKSTTIDFKAFYKRRILRLIPALLLLISIIIIPMMIRGNSTAVESVLKESLITLLYCSNWVRAFHLFPLNILDHTWSLSIEEQFYILWPLSFFLIAKFAKTNKKIIISISSLILLFTILRWFIAYKFFDSYHLYNAFYTRTDGLLLGCLLGHLMSLESFEKKMKAQAKLINYLSCISFLGLFILFFTMEWQSPAVYYYGFSLVNIFSILIILDLTISSKEKKIFNFPALVWAGKISYGLYLWHYPVYCILANLEYKSWEILAIGGPITFIFAALSYQCLEFPILKGSSRNRVGNF